MAIANTTIDAETMKKFVGSSKNGSLKFIPMTPARTIARQRDRRDERQDLHHVVRPLRGAAEVEVERADEQLARVLEAVDRPLEALDDPRPDRARGRTGARSPGRSSGQERLAVRGEHPAEARDPPAKREHARQERSSPRARTASSSSASMSRSIVSIWRKNAVKTASIRPAVKAAASSRPSSLSWPISCGTSSIAPSGPSWTVMTWFGPTTMSSSLPVGPRGHLGVDRAEGQDDAVGETQDARPAILAGQAAQPLGLEPDRGRGGGEVRDVAIVEIDPEQTVLSIAIVWSPARSTSRSSPFAS